MWSSKQREEQTIDMWSVRYRAILRTRQQRGSKNNTLQPHFPSLPTLRVWSHFPFLSNYPWIASISFVHNFSFAKIKLPHTQMADFPSKSSIVWRFYNKPAESSTHTVLCPKCHQDVRYQGTTSGLIRHLQRMHPTDFKKLNEQKVFFPHLTLNTLIYSISILMVQKSLRTRIKQKFFWQGNRKRLCKKNLSLQVFLHRSSPVPIFGKFRVQKVLRSPRS